MRALALLLCLALPAAAAPKPLKVPAAKVSHRRRGLCGLSIQLIRGTAHPRPAPPAVAK